MRRQLVRYFVEFSLAAFFLTSGAFGQTVTGSITGQVTDPSGAVVVGATVIAENAATSVKTSATTNAAGVYTIRFLPVGSYTVTIDATGFTSQKVPVFALEINQTAKIDAALKIGASTAVEVHETFHPILDTTDATPIIMASRRSMAIALKRTTTRSKVPRTTSRKTTLLATIPRLMRLPRCA